jgi:hypothetical protein
MSDRKVVWTEGDEPDPVTPENPLEGLELEVLRIWKENSGNVRAAHKKDPGRVENAVRRAVFDTLGGRTANAGGRGSGSRGDGADTSADVEASDVSDDVDVAAACGQDALIYTITQAADLTDGGWTAKLDANLAALRLLKTLRPEGRTATALSPASWIAVRPPRGQWAKPEVGS